MNYFQKTVCALTLAALSGCSERPAPNPEAFESNNILRLEGMGRYKVITDELDSVVALVPQPINVADSGDLFCYHRPGSDRFCTRGERVEMDDQLRSAVAKAWISSNGLRYNIARTRHECRTRNTGRGR